MVGHKPYKEKYEIKLRGIILDVEKKWFTFDIRPKNRDSREELKEVKQRVSKIEDGDYNYFRPTLPNATLIISYLNWESAKGLYKNPENNLPYEIISQYGELIYRQSIIEKKENIRDRLEKLAVEEDLRK